MAEQLLTFDYSKATLGASLGYTDGGTIKIATYVSFETDSYFDGFVSFGDNCKYGFKKDGKFYTEEGKWVGTLGIVAYSINQNTGTIITRGDDAEAFSISTLQPRETVALTCLQSMLSSFDVPLNIDNAKIKQLVGKSFVFAQEFVNQAVTYREKETASSAATSGKNVSVDSSSLSSDTDKILYNIQVALNNLITQGKNQFTEQQKNGLKLATTDVNIKTVPGNTKTVASGKADAAVSGSITTNQESAPSGT